MDNKFTVTQGQLPSSYINRAHIADKICNDFFLDFPLSHICMIINSYDEKSCSVYRDRLIKTMFNCWFKTRQNNAHFGFTRTNSGRFV